MSARIYLDYNATTPLHPDLLPLMGEKLTHSGNASSIHWAGRDAKRLITEARLSAAQFFSVEPTSLVFTSGGSEGNNLAIKGALSALAHSGGESRKEIICSSVEHPSVLKTVEHLVQHQGFTVHKLSVSRDGVIDLDQYEKILKTGKIGLVTCQLVNNETGNIFPIKKMSRLARENGALFHSDMVQALGKMSVPLNDLDVDLATFAGHKFYALKGAGLLYVKPGTHLESLIHGGAQERHRRAGTENALAISSLGDAVRILGPQLFKNIERIGLMRDQLEEKILKNISGAHLNGAKGDRVSNTINVSFDKIDGETLLINLDTQGYAVSSGAACSSGSQEPSPVLQAMGLNSEEASQSLRISLGWLTTQQELDGFFKVLEESVKRMREVYGTDD